MCLGEYDEESPKHFSMLSVALANHIAEEVKKRLLEEKFGIPMTVELEREVNEMCNLADAIEKQGIEQGIEQAALANAR